MSDLQLWGSFLDLDASGTVAVQISLVNWFELQQKTKPLLSLRDINGDNSMWSFF